MIKKCLRASLAICLGLAIGASSAQDAPSHSVVSTENYFNDYQLNQLASAQQMEICANVPVPTGWVVTNIRAGCGSGVGLYEINKLTPSQSMTMCAITPVPAGWIVTATQGGCTGGVTRYQIVYANPAYSSFDMCNVPNSTMPAGWVVKNALIGCGQPGYNKWQIVQALPQLGTMEVCKAGPVPAGWVVISSRPGCVGYSLITIKYMP